MRTIGCAGILLHPDAAIAHSSRALETIYCIHPEAVPQAADGQDDLARPGPPLIR